MSHENPVPGNTNQPTASDSPSGSGAPSIPSQQVDDERVTRLTQLLLHGCDALASGGGELVAFAEEFRSILTRAPRVAVVGRLKAGKSTLVNALTQHRVAATGSLECTMAVSLYSDGAPARAEIHGVDGEVDRVQLSEGQPLEDLGRPLEEVSYIHQFLPNASLAELGLVDTPGTATLTVENEQRTRAILIDGSSDTRRATRWADSVVFLSDSAPREDERDFLTELGMTPLTIIGVLSRADSFGAGAFGPHDPLSAAAQHTNRIKKELGDTVLEVLPLSGLLAETAATGGITNTLARQLATLAPLSREELLDVLEGATAQLPGALKSTDITTLLDTVGEYGVFNARNVAAERGAVGLVHWLEQASGIHRLRDILTQQVKYYAVLQRAVGILDRIAELATSNHPQRDHVRWMQSVTLAQPDIARVMLYRSYRDTFLSTPDSRLLPQLRRSIDAQSVAEFVGLAADESPTDEQVRAALDAGIGELQQMAMLPLSSAEDDARERLIQEHHRWYQQLGPTVPGTGPGTGPGTDLGT